MEADSERQKTLDVDCYTKCAMSRELRGRHRMRSGKAYAACCVLIAVSIATSAGAGARTGVNAPSETAVDLVRSAVTNEVAAAKASSIKHMFRDRKETPRGSQTRIYVETGQAMAGMLVANNDQPLAPEQKKAESERLAALISNPERLRQKQAREKEDEERTLSIMKALPDAFRFEYAETSAGESDANTRDQLVRLNFVPNPDYDPPSRVEQVLTGMRGYVLINTKCMRLAKIDGTLFKDVTFGWGFFGRLDKGGHFLVQQGDVGEGDWDIMRMSLSFTGKILLFKTLNIASDEVFSDFRQVPGNLTFAQGVEMLKSEQEKLAHNISAEEPGVKKNSR
jgi:hypothetical protein